MLADLAPDFPPNLTIFEVCVSHGDVTAFVPWTDIMNKYTYSKEEPYFNILVPTGETTCYNWLLQTLVGAGQHTMIIGETGTGKSVTVQAYLKQLPENASSIQAAFSAQTSALNMQDILESKLDKLRKNLLGAPPGRQTVLLTLSLTLSLTLALALALALTLTLTLIRCSLSTTSTCPRSRSTARSRPSSS